jgi:hypothetical protein
MLEDIFNSLAQQLNQKAQYALTRRERRGVTKRKRVGSGSYTCIGLISE